MAKNVLAKGAKIYCSHCDQPLFKLNCEKMIGDRWEAKDMDPLSSQPKPLTNEDIVKCSHCGSVQDTVRLEPLTEQVNKEMN